MQYYTILGYSALYYTRPGELGLFCLGTRGEALPKRGALRASGQREGRGPSLLLSLSLLLAYLQVSLRLSLSLYIYIYTHAYMYLYVYMNICFLPRPITLILGVSEIRRTSHVEQQ